MTEPIHIWLPQAMDDAGVSIAELADALGVSAATVASWRVGRRRPCCQFMRRALADAVRTLAARSRRHRTT